MKRLLIILLCFWTSNSISQSRDTILIIPKTGIVLQLDTLKLGQDSPTSLISKIDTLQFKLTEIQRTALACGVISKTNKRTGKVKSKDASWTIYYSTIKIGDQILAEFEGDSFENLKLKSLKVSYPQEAKTINGIQIGDYHKRVFQFYSEVEGSFSCFSRGYYYCYIMHGIGFEVKMFKEEPYLDMNEKITGIEIF